MQGAEKEARSDEIFIFQIRAFAGKCGRENGKHGNGGDEKDPRHPRAEPGVWNPGEPGCCEGGEFAASKYWNEVDVLKKYYEHHGHYESNEILMSSKAGDFNSSPFECDVGEDG